MKTTDSENFDTDDRVTCVSCQHLYGWPGRWRCKNWRIAAVGNDDALAGDLIELKQRCPGWRAATESKTD